jgi:hypothetical protein
MLINKKIITISCLCAVVAFSALTSMRADNNGHDDHDHMAPKNLKVLPKNIPHEVLHQVMDEWSQALGVHCNFCHAKGDDGKMDFASDARPEKNIAREMYKMTAKINDKYFEGKKDSLAMVIGDIKCMTCHHGSPHPGEAKDTGMDHDHDMHGPGPGGMPGPPPGGDKGSNPPPGGN